MGDPERFPNFPPTISPIVGGICFVQRDTWRPPERPIRPHRGPHSPNGWTSDRVWLPAREPERRRARSEALECVSDSTGPRVRPSQRSGIQCGANDQDSLTWHYPVRSMAFRSKRSRCGDLSKTHLGIKSKDSLVFSGVIVVVKTDPAHHPGSLRSTSFGD